MSNMPPRIAIPVPHSGDSDYAERSLPQYERAVQMAGGEPVRVPLDRGRDGAMQVIEGCHAVLLPGSRADVDPSRYKTARHPKTAEIDAKREAVDELLLQDAYAQRKPILAICYGLQSLNVHCSGTLIQDIRDFLPAEKQVINHEAGRGVAVAHGVQVEPDSKLGQILKMSGDDGPLLAVNSSHHQSADAPGKGLRVVARCPEDGIIEGLEGTAADHFVLAVQWHPERSTEDAASRGIFQALIEAARGTK
jgi:putative glutamine amidotransferase